MHQGDVDKYVSALLAAGEAIETALGFRNVPIGQEAAPAAMPKAPQRQSKTRS
jgi:hypothetical protein